jgi:predicted nucleic acid-binding protein
LIAKERGLVKNIGPIVERMRNEGYWLSEDVIRAARTLAGEE